MGEHAGATGSGVGSDAGNSEATASMRHAKTTSKRVIVIVPSLREMCDSLMRYLPRMSSTVMSSLLDCN